jgi:lipopolysaccharide export system protein LptA
MKWLIVCTWLLLGFFAADLRAQNLSAAALASPGRPQKKAEEKKDPIKDAVGGAALPPGQAITTEIYADEAFFDSANHIGIFTGHVIVNDPRFNVQSDKLTIYLNKDQIGGGKPNDAPPKEDPAEKGQTAPQALEKAVAEGNVGVVRDRPDEKGGPPVRSVGRADMAVYTASDGNVELRGTPRVQSGLNMHVATSPDTVMVINQNGQLVTRGPSRTEIRQEPKTSPTPAPAPAAKP